MKIRGINSTYLLLPDKVLFLWESTINGSVLLFSSTRSRLKLRHSPGELSVCQKAIRLDWYDHHKLTQSKRNRVLWQPYAFMLPACCYYSFNHSLLWVILQIKAAIKIIMIIMHNNKLKSILMIGMSIRTGIWYCHVINLCLFID